MPLSDHGSRIIINKVILNRFSMSSPPPFPKDNLCHPTQWAAKIHSKMFVKIYSFEDPFLVFDGRKTLYLLNHISRHQLVL